MSFLESRYNHICLPISGSFAKLPRNLTHSRQPENSFSSQRFQHLWSNFIFTSSFSRFYPFDLFNVLYQKCQVLIFIVKIIFVNIIFNITSNKNLSTITTILNSQSQPVLKFSVPNSIPYNHNFAHYS